LLNRNDWCRIREQCKFVKTSKRFRPYGTAYHLPKKGKAQVTLQAKRGETISTWIYVVDDPKEQSLLGEQDATRLGIVKLNVDGASDVIVQHLSDSTDETYQKVSGRQIQQEIDANMDKIVQEFSSVFSHSTGKIAGDPIKIHVKSDAKPVV